MPAADRIIAEARTWLGTPYRNCEDVKGAGIDCGMMLVRVVVDLGLVAPFDPRPYSPQHHMHSSEQKYLSFVLPHCEEISKPELGAAIVFRVGRSHAHGAWISGVNPLRIIHAWSPYRRVVEEYLRENPRLIEPKRAPRYFRVQA